MEFPFTRFHLIRIFKTTQLERSIAAVMFGKDDFRQYWRNVLLLMEQMAGRELLRLLNPILKPGASASRFHLMGCSEQQILVPAGCVFNLLCVRHVMSSR